MFGSVSYQHHWGPLLTHRLATPRSPQLAASLLAPANVPD